MGDWVACVWDLFMRDMSCCGGVCGCTVPSAPHLSLQLGLKCSRVLAAALALVYQASLERGCTSLVFARPLHSPSLPCGLFGLVCRVSAGVYTARALRIFRV